jgi:hypothetical protein
MSSSTQLLLLYCIVNSTDDEVVLSVILSSICPFPRHGILQRLSSFCHQTSSKWLKIHIFSGTPINQHNSERPVPPTVTVHKMNWFEMTHHHWHGRLRLATREIWEDRSNYRFRAWMFSFMCSLLML